MMMKTISQRHEQRLVRRTVTTSDQLPDRALGIPGPAVLSQGSWLHDRVFVSSLHSSWQSQYADYLGTETATALLDHLCNTGEIYSHHEPGTILARVDSQLVGVAALRALEGVSLITLLEVLDSHSGQGIGHQLVEALATSEQRLLTHVSIHRPRVMRFYQSLGFQALQRATVDHHGYPLEFDVMVR